MNEEHEYDATYMYLCTGVSPVEKLGVSSLPKEMLPTHSMIGAAAADQVEILGVSSRPKRKCYIHIL